MPDQLQTAIPAHGILHFQPSESVEISRYDHFTYEKRWQNKAKFNRVENRTLNFTPAGTFPANTGKILYRVEQGKAYNVKPLNKTLLRGVSIQTFDKEIILGIDSVSTGDFYLYFDWISEKSKKILFNSISKVNITLLNGQKLSTNWVLNLKENNRDYFNEKFNDLVKMERNIMGFFQNQFLKL